MSTLQTVSIWYFVIGNIAWIILTLFRPSNFEPSFAVVLVGYLFVTVMWPILIWYFLRAGRNDE